MAHSYGQWSIWPITRPADNALLGCTVFSQVTSDGASTYALFPDTPTKMQELGNLLRNQPIRIRSLSLTANTMTAPSYMYWGVRNKVSDTMFALGEGTVLLPETVAAIDVGPAGAILQPDWANFDTTDYFSHIAMDPVVLNGEIFKIGMQIELFEPISFTGHVPRPAFNMGQTVPYDPVGYPRVKR